ncbi:MAG: hypothetical protein U5K84_03590 [Alkalibacterium sp.]|nr:hypothetical protein [Alkalibacterium sp.]
MIRSQTTPGAFFYRQDLANTNTWESNRQKMQEAIAGDSNQFLKRLVNLKKHLTAPCIWYPDVATESPLLYVMSKAG